MKALLAAGGTGGHLFPAEAVATVLTRRGHLVELVTDARAQPFLDTFPAAATHMVAAATLKRRDPVSFARMALTNAGGLAKCLAIYRRFQPNVAVGFGGYPTLPPMNAARVTRTPAIVHEANAVVGRANRSLARFAHVASHFPGVAGLPAGRGTVVGMPVREAVRKAARPYAQADDVFRLLVFGGSQGARVFADIVPFAVAALPASDRARLALVQQARPEDETRVREAYAAANVKAEIAPFFRDLPERMAAAHLVIARSGAGTVAELSVIGRPALLVPLPGALDQDQGHNAAAFEAAGAGTRIDQSALSSERLTRELASAMADPAGLTAKAQRAAAFGKPDAADALADLAERIAGAERAAA